MKDAFTEEWEVCAAEAHDQSVPYAARIARVRHLGQTLQQARDLPGYGPGMLAELVKGKRDRR
ncbi:hypothetical protein ABT173_33425 [Streptomyces sp. NPDC001795]|uniref:hypothetical protein n=1 Tax=unclassified Streptomyces TaxID=2593676 RepID=UPI003316A900